MESNRQGIAVFQLFFFHPHKVWHRLAPAFYPLYPKASHMPFDMGKNVFSSLQPADFCFPRSFCGQPFFYPRQRFISLKGGKFPQTGEKSLLRSPDNANPALLLQK